MLPILWRAEAQADLAAIFAYIAERNPQSALDLYNHIERVVSQLPQHPHLYRPGRVSGTRELVAPQLYRRISPQRDRDRDSLDSAFATALSLISKAIPWPLHARSAAGI